MSILAILNQLAADSGRLAKEQILSENSDNELLKEVLRLTLDKTINFHIKQIPAHSPSGETELDLEFLKGLEQLTKRCVTGNAAVEFLSGMLSMLNEDDAEVVARIISRDLKCGVNSATVNKVFAKLIPEFPYMRCSSFSQKLADALNWKEGVVSQLKADGMFVNITITEDGDIEFMSRNGSEHDKKHYPQLSTELLKLGLTGVCIQGELLVRDADNTLLPREVGNGLLNSAFKGGEIPEGHTVVADVWDIVPTSFETDLGYVERYNMLKRAMLEHTDLFAVSLIETKMVYSLEEAYEHYFQKVADGMEGTILKDPNAKWVNSTSRQQLKMKLEVDVDLKIVGYTPGKGKNESTFGSITCETSDGELSVNVSGFKDKPQKGILTRQQIWDQRDELLGTILTVRFNNIMKPTASNHLHSLFLPRAVEFRSDKDVADSLERVFEQFEAAIKQGAK